MDIQGKSIVIRHSIREAITDSKDSYHQPLTKEGVELAVQLGERLSVYAHAFILFHSPLPRCQQTAAAISTGITAGQKLVIDIKPYEPLGGFYFRNWPYCAELMNRHTFTQMWLANEIPDNCVMPIKDAGTYLLTEITRQSHPNATNIFITHDGNLLALKSVLLSKDEEIKVPGYLEGVVISEEFKEFVVF